MPELPEVETVRKGLEPVMVGQTITGVDLRRRDLRRPFPRGFAVHLTGRRVLRLGRRGKHLIADLDNGDCLVMHLGMSGSFRIEFDDSAIRKTRARIAPGKHDHVVFHLSSGKRVLYNDPRRFGSMDLGTAQGLWGRPPLRTLGLEPLDGDLTADRLAHKLAGKGTSIKAALLDQRIVAGLGNIYASEALWHARISPPRAAGSMVDEGGRATADCKRLPRAITNVLEAAIASGGSSLRDHVQTDGSPGTFQHRFKVYDRQGSRCPRAGCRGMIRRLVQSGRSTFYCPSCQH